MPIKQRGPSVYLRVHSGGYPREPRGYVSVLNWYAMGPNWYVEVPRGVVWVLSKHKGVPSRLQRGDYGTVILVGMLVYLLGTKGYKVLTCG